MAVVFRAGIGVYSSIGEKKVQVMVKSILGTEVDVTATLEAMFWGFFLTPAASVIHLVKIVVIRHIKQRLDFSSM